MGPKLLMLYYFIISTVISSSTVIVIESVAISFGSNAPITSQKVESPTSPSNQQPTCKSYEKPKWNSFRLNVTFKDKTYQGEFMEHQTLEDLYSWVKTQLLNDNIFTPGTDLLLSSDNVKCPLKANTANNTLGALAFNHFVCSEIQQVKKGSGFGDTESKYDTRFSLPIDMRLLEDLDPLQYLSRYCCISEPWKKFYRNIFTQHDRDRDGSLSYDELKSAMEKLFVELGNPLLKRILFLLGFNPASHDASFSMDHVTFEDSDNSVRESWKDAFKIRKEIFVLICALANRIICRENKIDGFCVANVTQSHTELEDADFYNLEGKMRECALDPLTRRLLLYIKK